MNLLSWKWSIYVTSLPGEHQDVTNVAHWYTLSFHFLYTFSFHFWYTFSFHFSFRLNFCVSILSVTPTLNILFKFITLSKGVKCVTVSNRVRIIETKLLLPVQYLLEIKIVAEKWLTFRAVLIFRIFVLVFWPMQNFVFNHFNTYTKKWEVLQK